MIAVTVPGVEERRGSRVRLIVVLAIVAYVVLFVVLNTDRVRISFVFFSLRTSLLFALILAAVLGFVAGYLTKRSRVRRKA